MILYIIKQSYYIYLRFDKKLFDVILSELVTSSTLLTTL